MNYPYKIIESKISVRHQFEIVEGYQPTHAFFYLKKGLLFLTIDGKREELGVGDCMILPDYIYFRRSILTPIEFVYVKFAKNADFPYQMDIPYGKVKFKDKKRFASSISAFESLILSDEIAAVSYREHLINDILLQVHFERHDVKEHIEKRYSDATVRKAVEYICENLEKKLMIDDICRAIGTNPSTLNYKIRRETGMSCGKLIMNERMKKAKHLLISSTYNISDIAIRCGFENLYYFSNAFKKENGVSPSKYLRLNGNFPITSK